MVPQKLTRWEAPHVSDSASEVPPSLLFFCAHLSFFLCPSFFSPLSLTVCLTHFLPPILPLPALSFKSFSRSPPSLPLTLLSIQSWSTDYTVTFCFILSQTPEGKPFQDISQQSNTPTLSLSWTASTQASSPDTQHTPTHTHTHTHTHTLASFCITRVSLTCHDWYGSTTPRRFFLCVCACRPQISRAATYASKDGICWGQETTQFIYRFINVWMQRS